MSWPTFETTFETTSFFGDDDIPIVMIWQINKKPFPGRPGSFHDPGEPPEGSEIELLDVKHEDGTPVEISEKDLIELSAVEYNAAQIIANDLVCEIVHYERDKVTGLR